MKLKKVKLIKYNKKDTPLNIEKDESYETKVSIQRLTLNCPLCGSACSFRNEPAFNYQRICNHHFDLPDPIVWEPNYNYLIIKYFEKEKDNFEEINKISDLKIGDIIRSKFSKQSYIISYFSKKDEAVAIQTLTVTNPREWELFIKND